MGIVGDFWKWFRSRHWIVQGFGALVALFVVGMILLAATGGGGQTVTTTAAPTVATSAQTPAQATAQPTLGVFDGMLVEHPASAGGPDQSGAMTDLGVSNAAVLQPGFQRETIDGRDVYVAALQLNGNGGNYQTIYVFPLGSYNEALPVQAAYVKQFEANGFTPSGPASLTGAGTGSQANTVTLQSQTYDQPVTVVAVFSSSLAPNGGVIINVPGIVPNWVSSS